MSTSLKRKLSPSRSPALGESAEKKHKEQNGTDASDVAEQFDVVDDEWLERECDPAIFIDQETLKKSKYDGCCVCFKVPKEAHETSCGHLYCKACIEKSIATKQSCPTCRQHLTSFQASTFAQRTIDDFHVMCVFHDTVSFSSSPASATAPLSKVKFEFCLWVLVHL